MHDGRHRPSRSFFFLSINTRKGWYGFFSRSACAHLGKRYGMFVTISAYNSVRNASIFPRTTSWSPTDRVWYLRRRLAIRVPTHDPISVAAGVLACYLTCGCRRCWGCRRDRPLIPDHNGNVTWSLFPWRSPIDGIRDSADPISRPRPLWIPRSGKRYSGSFLRIRGTPRCVIP